MDDNSKDQTIGVAGTPKKAVGEQWSDFWDSIREPWTVSLLVISGIRFP